MRMQYFSVDPPAQWRAGFAGTDRAPLYFDCADCGAKAPATEAALVVGLALGSRFQLTSADLRTARETLSLEAGGSIAAAAVRSHVARRRVWKADR